MALEAKLDGYRAIALKCLGTVHLRQQQGFQRADPTVATALARLPDDTVIDGEIVAFDQDGRPSFNALQNYGSAPAPVVYVTIGGSFGFFGNCTRTSRNGPSGLQPCVHGCSSGIGTVGSGYGSRRYGDT